VLVGRLGCMNKFLDPSLSDCSLSTPLLRTRYDQMRGLYASTNIDKADGLEESAQQQQPSSMGTNGESTTNNDHIESPSPSSLPLHQPSAVTPSSTPQSNNESASSSSLHRKQNPITTLLFFLHRRTIEHHRNFSLSELSGSLGDLGTFIPLTVALARERKIALAPALFWAGVSNVVTGYAWDVPMCVQPMKSIAAVALTDVGVGSATAASTGLDAQSVTTAGILTGGAVFVLGVTNLMEVVNWIVPLTVVCGLQIGVGLRLASKGILDIQNLNWGGGYDCIGLAVACALLSMFWLRDNENGMKRKEDGATTEGSSGSGRSSSTMKNSSQTNCNDGDGLAGTIRNSLTPSSDCGMESNNNNVEMGKLDNAHQLETAATLHPRSSISTPARTASNSSSSSSSPSHFNQILKRACCCLDPFPKTPHPVGIYLFLIGCLFAAITLATAAPDSGYDLPLRFFGAPVVINAMKDVTPLNWRQGFLQGTLPQLPLTTLNSVISVCCLAHSLYPEKRIPSLVEARRTDAVVTRREVSVSVGLMNLLLCPLGSMPNCHGAGGLAGQHRFGARHGTSVAILGMCKVFLAVFLGASALTLLDALPVAVLGVMIVIAGLELVGTGVSVLFECVRTEEEETSARIDALRAGNDGGVMVVVNSKAILRKNALVVMVTAGVIVALKKTHYGAISGWVVHMVYGDGFRKFLGWANKKRQRRRYEDSDD